MSHSSISLPSDLDLDPDIDTDNTTTPDTQPLLRPHWCHIHNSISTSHTNTLSWVPTRAARTIRWHERLTRLKDCLTPATTTQRRPSTQIGCYEGFEVQSPSRKTSDSSDTAMSRMSTSTSTSSSSGGRLSRLNTRLSETFHCGYGKLDVDPEEKAARQEEKRRRPLEWMGGPYDQSGVEMGAAQEYCYGTHASGVVDWRYALAYMGM